MLENGRFGKCLLHVKGVSYSSYFDDLHGQS
jgi:hypothetical protein